LRDRRTKIKRKVLKLVGIKVSRIIVGFFFVLAQRDAVPEGTRWVRRPYPGLTSGANKFRPFGTRRLICFFFTVSICQTLHERSGQDCLSVQNQLPKTF